MVSLKIAHLYPKTLNNSGDNGNILVLKKRCEWRNIDVQLNEYELGDLITEKHDLYYIGGHSGIQEDLVCNDIQNNKDFFTKEANNMSVLLGIGAGFQLMCKYYVSKEEKHDCLGLINAYTEKSNKRFSGNITLETNLVEPHTLVGFENHNDLTFLNEDTSPMGIVSLGNGNNGIDKTEGARVNNIFGTYLQGPFLAKNVHFADYLIELALGFKPEPIDNTIENLTHESLILKR